MKNFTVVDKRFLFQKEFNPSHGVVVDQPEDLCLINFLYDIIHKLYDNCYFTGNNIRKFSSTESDNLIGYQTFASVLFDRKEELYTMYVLIKKETENWSIYGRSELLPTTDKLPVSNLVFRSDLLIKPYQYFKG